MDLSESPELVAFRAGLRKWLRDNVIEQGPDSFGAYVPDLPGCIAAAETREEVLRLIREAIEFHLEGLKDEGVSLPQPHSFSEFVEVRA